MKTLTGNGMRAVLVVAKSPEKAFNSRTLAKELGISSMGALKIFKGLEADGIFSRKPMGKANFISINWENHFAKSLILFLFQREAADAGPEVKVWLREIRKIKNADAALLFGSALQHAREAKDIDVLLIVGQSMFSAVKDEIGGINIINKKKIHPLFQSQNDFVRNVKKGDPAVLDAIKGLAVFGGDIILKGLMP